uniref:Uncharacterized protein n=1 Tax=Nelumbo nucifera TaxID=4432 RepID=A0A822XZ86_NELNU|nr:TPA_asm: hypothetical protein HUJ06_024161 [Nelumbo nucifera]
MIGLAPTKIFSLGFANFCPVFIMFYLNFPFKLCIFHVAVSPLSPICYINSVSEEFSFRCIMVYLILHIYEGGVGHVDCRGGVVTDRGREGWVTKEGRAWRRGEKEKGGEVTGIGGFNFLFTLLFLLYMSLYRNSYLIVFI